MNNLKELGKALVSADRILCLQTLSAPGGKEYAVEVTFDTGQVVTIEDSDPAAAISRYSESSSSVDSAGTT